jgi:putative endonuclease
MWRAGCESPRSVTRYRQELGKGGEDLAADVLVARGYAILDRRYRTRHGEIDIVAQHGATLVFIEVRARTTAEFGRAAETVTAAKRRKVMAMAAEYLARHRITNRPCRFDVVAIDGARGERPEVTVFPNAFESG